MVWPSISLKEDVTLAIVPNVKHHLFLSIVSYVYVYTNFTTKMNQIILFNTSEIDGCVSNKELETHTVLLCNTHKISVTLIMLFGFSNTLTKKFMEAQCSLQWVAVWSPLEIIIFKVDCYSKKRRFLEGIFDPIRNFCIKRTKHGQRSNPWGTEIF